MKTTKLDDKVANELMQNIMSTEGSSNFKRDVLFHLNLAYAGKAHITLETVTLMELLLGAGLIVETKPVGEYGKDYVMVPPADVYTVTAKGKEFVEKYYAGKTVMGIKVPKKTD